MFNDIDLTWMEPSVLYVHSQLQYVPDFGYGVHVQDVDYVDISDAPITDPARLLSQESVTPFWVEFRRREAQVDAIADFSNALETMLRDFYRNKLILARGANHCPYKWEYEYSEKILDLFCEFEETVLSALKIFFARASDLSEYLWEFFGYNNEEFAQMKTEQREYERLQTLHNDFCHAVYCLLHKGDDPDDDLPF